MGDLRKKFTFSKVAMLCLVAFVAIFTFSVSVSALATKRSLFPVGRQDITDANNLEWVKIADTNGNGYADGAFDHGTHTLYISEPLELAYFNYQIKNNLFDFSNWTIILRSNLDLGECKLQPSGGTVTPFWTPIPIGVSGTNTNIKFDGDGHYIKNMKVSLSDEVADWQNIGVGFFSNLIGGSVENLEFINPEISYTYHCDDPTARQLVQPVEITVGVVAGTAEGTEIRDVTITNPKVVFTTRNYSGHQFAIGGVVGKLTDYYVSDSSKPTMGVIDAAIVENGRVEYTVNGGAAGTEMQSNLGGVSGINFSGKIINSKVKSVALKATLGSGIKGKYYHGGLVGQSALRVRKRTDVSAVGLLNNMVISDVTVTGKTDTTYTGGIAGWVCGNFVHSNFYFGPPYYTAGAGETITEAQNKNLFGLGVTNDSATYYTQDCYGYVNRDALNEFYIHDDYICGNSTAVDGRFYFSCNIASHTKSLDIFNKTTANETNYNFSNTSQIESYLPALNNFDQNSDGELTKMADLIIEYDYAGDRSAFREAVNQFRKWVVDPETGELKFGDSIGKLYPVTFHANGTDDDPAGFAVRFDVEDDTEDDDRTDDDAVWEEEYGAEDYREDYFPANAVPTMVRKYTTEDEILEPGTDELPIRVGYVFTGWYLSPNNIDQQLDYFTDPAIKPVMKGAPIDLYAGWRTGRYKIKFYKGINDPWYEPSNTIGFHETIFDLPATEPKMEGAEFAGWYVRTDLLSDFSVAPGAERWDFQTDLMPGHNLNLYAGWVYAFSDLREAANEAEELYLTAENRKYVTEESYQNLEAIVREIYAKIKDPSAVGRDSSVLKNELQNAIDNLSVDINLLELHQALTDPTLRQNRYPFLYDAKAYANYLAAKQLANSYKDVFYSGDKNNVATFKIIYNGLDDAFVALSTSPNANLGGRDVSSLLTDYEMLRNSADGFDENEFDKNLWADFINAQKKFNDAFNSDNPHYDDLQAVISNVKLAMNALFDGNSAGNNDKPTTQIPFLLIGILVCVVIVLGVGGFIGFDMYKHSSRKAKVKTAAGGTPSQLGQVEDNDDSDYV